MTAFLLPVLRAELCTCRVPCLSSAQNVLLGDTVRSPNFYLKLCDLGSAHTMACPDTEKLTADTASVNLGTCASACGSLTGRGAAVRPGC